MKPFQDYRIYAAVLWGEDLSVVEKSRSKISYQKEKGNLSGKSKTNTE